MDKELEIAIFISALIKAGRDYNDKDIYALYEGQNVAEIGKRTHEALQSLGYGLTALPAEIESEVLLTTNEGE